MRKNRQFIIGSSDGRTRYFHVVSRTAGKRILFGDDERETFRKILFKQLKFSGLRALAWCFMGNHFHLLLELPDKELALEGWTEDDLIDRLSVLKDEFSTRMILGDVEMFRGNGHADGVSEIANRVRERLFDLSAFMKELKQKFSIAYNFKHGRSGTLWEGRYKSTLVDSDNYFFTVSRYIELNPVRAEMVSNPAQYRWSSHRSNAQGYPCGLLAPHELYQRLGKTTEARQRQYSKFFEEELSAEILEDLRYATNRSWAFGSEEFLARIASVANRRPDSRGRGGDRRLSQGV